jgi:phosphoribosylamine--glycine ligase
MNILILGSGGREHALAWRLSQDPSAKNVFVWPGNAGIFLDKKIREISAPFDFDSFATTIKELDITLVVPGAEKYLYEGISDECRKLGVDCFGPSLAAAQLERSKLFSKRIMSKAQIPTARFTDLTPVFESNLDGAKAILEDYQMPVIKISGPSLGKGVFVCKSPVEAFEILQKIKGHPMEGLEEGIFVEEGIEGKEVSLFFACHDQNFNFLGAAQDHKRLLDQDLGPNTGGMGTVSPVKWVDESFLASAIEKFVKPTLKTMREEGAPFSGVLFLGFMVNQSGAYLLEYNVRFGDPETQVILPLIEGDLTHFLSSLMKGETELPELTLKNESAIHVVKAARGYPGTFGDEIERNQTVHFHPTTPNHYKFFFAGVRSQNGELLTSGGRVLGVTAWDLTKDLARIKAYERLRDITFSGEHFRKDIGLKT